MDFPDQEMKPFTQQLAEHIRDKAYPLKHLHIILPSQRAIKYLSRDLYTTFGTPLFAPKMQSMSNWVKDLSEKPLAHSTLLLLRLYEVYVQQYGEHEDFDEFLNWGTSLIGDINDIERYQLDAKQVFASLNDIRKLEGWNLGDAPNEMQLKFLAFWEKLPVLHKLLLENLNEQKLFCSGSAYRSVADDISTVFRDDKDAFFIFAGFNALSKSEQSIMKQLHVMGRAEIILDADHFYLDSPIHEAGRFMRDLVKELNIREPSFVSSSLLDDTKQIDIYECAQNTGQIKVAASLLESLSKDEIDQTLLLLADEKLIAPLVKNLPKNIGAANITLGLPLGSSPIKTWVELLFAFQESALRFKTSAVYHANLTRLLKHPFLLSSYSDAEYDQVNAVEEEIIRFNKIFIKVENLKVADWLKEIITQFNLNWHQDYPKGIKTMRLLNASVYERMKERDHYEMALIAAFDRALIDFENIISQAQLPEMKLKSFKSLFRQHWSSQSLAYHGNPLDGLQIMGLLETRLLNFKRIIALGMNEGTLPPLNPINTLLPMDLRRFFALPSAREKQGLFAHHFYRLLHQCEHFACTYVSGSDITGTMEKSRYLTQLELELAKVNPKIKINKHFMMIPNEEHLAAQKLVAKSEDIFKRMDTLFERSLSVSAMNKYLKCSLDFYYRYVVDFGEESKVDEEIEMSTFGSNIHNTLEELYLPFARRNKDWELVNPDTKPVTALDVERMLKSFEPILERYFLESFDNNRDIVFNGKNYLSFEIAKEMMRKFFEKEREYILNNPPLYIECLELPLRETLTLDVNGQEKTVNLNGIVDRIDSVNGRFRIVDYKSGKLKDEDVQLKKAINSEELLEQISAVKHANQLLNYAFLFQKKTGILPTQVGIFSLINQDKGFRSLESKSNYEEWVDHYPFFINQLLEAIYSELPFEHIDTFQKSYCVYC